MLLPLGQRDRRLRLPRIKWGNCPAKLRPGLRGVFAEYLEAFQGINLPEARAVSTFGRWYIETLDEKGRIVDL